MTRTASRAGKPLPFYGGECYACRSNATGFRDRRLEGKGLEPACDRHRDPTVAVFHACTYCDGPRPTVIIDKMFAHKSCHEADVDQ